MKQMLLMCAVMAVIACGKDKGGDKGGGGGAPAGGPSCAEAAAQYAKLNAEGGGNHLAKLKPTPDQLKVVTGKLEAHCTATNWSAENKKCVMDAKTDFDLSKNCFKTPKGSALQVGQVLFDAVAELKAAAPAATDTAPAGSATGSAAAGSGSAAAGSGSAK